MKKFSLLLLLGLLTIFSNAQNDSNFDGKYVGKFDEGGFPDSLIIQGDSLIHILNEGWGYGIEHQYIYAIIELKDDLVKFEQIGCLRERKSDPKTQRKGFMHMQQVKTTKLENGDIGFTASGHPNNPQIFELVSL